MISKDKIWVRDNWIHVDGVGRIGLYAKDKHAILLDYSMKWIVGSNEEIPCREDEIKDKILKLFNDDNNSKGTSLQSI